MSNLRARNYKIEEIGWMDLKLIAGKIIPALATTTSMVTGYVALEVFKHAMDLEFGKRCNLFANLAINQYFLSEPMKPKVEKDKDYDPIMLGPVKTVPRNYNTWTKIEIEGPLTLQNFIDKINSRYEVTINCVFIGSKELFGDFNSKLRDNLNVDLSTLYLKYYPDN